MTEESTVLELATIRKNRGITLEQIASVTKIGVRTLEAIERGEFRKLPGGIYDTSYIRQYARAIDYDEDAILAEYRRARCPEKHRCSPARVFRQLPHGVTAGPNLFVAQGNRWAHAGGAIRRQKCGGDSRDREHEARRR